MEFIITSRANAFLFVSKDQHGSAADDLSESTGSKNAVAHSSATIILVSLRKRVIATAEKENGEKSTLLC